VRKLTSRIVPSLRRRLGEARTALLRARLSSQARALDSSGISIVSNNCVAGILYEWAGLAKQTPTAGIYFVGPAYTQFLDDLAAGHMQQWLDLEPSKLAYRDAQCCWALPSASGGELVFLHYPDADEAIDKWTRRIARLRGRTPLIISSMRDNITAESLMPVLEKFRFTFTVNGDPTPPADDLLLNSKFLRAFSDYLDRVLGALPAGRVADEITV
jgi:uncharacterized protein (DUF1919 family)